MEISLESQSSRVVCRRFFSGRVWVIWHRARRVPRPPHQGQDLRIDAVGLGQFAHGAGEFAGLTRVHAGIRRARAGQRLGHASLIPARGLEDDKPITHGLGKTRKGLFCRGNTFVFGRGQIENVDPILGDIDADEILWQGHEGLSLICEVNRWSGASGNCSG